MRALLLTLLILGLTSPVFAETVQVEDRHLFHSHTRDVTVHDKTVDTNTQRDVKENDDLKINAELEIDEFVKVTDNFKINLNAGKDIHRTNTNDGWYFGVKGVLKFTAFDFTKKGE